MQTADPFDGVIDTTHLLMDLVDSETSYIGRRNRRAELGYVACGAEIRGGTLPPDLAVSNDH